MSTRGRPRWSSTALAGLAAALMALAFAGGPHRAAALLRGMPRATAGAVHVADASALPLEHRAVKTAAHVATADATLAPAVLAIGIAALLVAAARPRRPRAQPVASARSRAPPTRH